MNIGIHSLNNRIHGECEALAAQSIEKWKNKEYWKMWAKIMAVRFDEYPSKEVVEMRKGKPVKFRWPKSLAEATNAEAMKVQMEIQVHADENDLWLWEFRKSNETDTLVYRSLGGRTFDQMQDYIKDIQEMIDQIKDKDEAEALRLKDRIDELSVTKHSRNTAGALTAEQVEKNKEAYQPEIW